MLDVNARGDSGPGDHDLHAGSDNRRPDNRAPDHCGTDNYDDRTHYDNHDRPDHRSDRFDDH